MCGIIAFNGINTEENRDYVQRLLCEVSYRGVHSTGISIMNPVVGLVTLTQPGSAQAFLKSFPLDAIAHGAEYLTMIGHTRYCTSYPEWPQPIEIPGTGALALNGVISQAHPAFWPFRDRFTYVTANDAEIALLLALSGEIGATPGSYASAFLREQGELSCWRNGYRPLYLHRGEDFTAAASTRDAFRRAGTVVLSDGLMAPGMIAKLTPSTIVRHPNDFVPNGQDVQPHDYTSTRKLQCKI